ncbi:FAD binding domain-containing protein [Aspergillus sclerotialis]|uniref:FAD binding domain-containing protein n=1 Tax=Aspergillus sclerotialis TaxID=2070753 RepID=A0A3A2ZJQ1_9EURO|nr:FAD binding domain-containing protein [Aspergillus sclerotialis]
MSQSPIIIVGAGITGLVLAQSLKKHCIPFQVYERDPNPSYRGKGWGITIHWALDSLIDCLPRHITDRLPEAYVDPEATRNGENGNFLFFNLRSGEALWQVPPSKRIRMAREKFRRLLMDGIDIKWDHTFHSFEPSDGAVKATFNTPNGPHTIEGSIIVGCDGSHSRVRASLFPAPEIHLNYQLPVRLLGVSTIYPGKLAAKMRQLDPFFFQGGDPLTNASHWFSFLDSPETSGRGDDTRDCQILVSWPHRQGFLGEENPLEVPSRRRDRVAFMKRVASGWTNPFHEIVQSIPEDAEPKTITLEDWVPPHDQWTSVPGSGRVVLVGDAAHAMTMYRGEAANHGIMDVQLLLSFILPLLTTGDTVCGERLTEACESYTQDMVERTAPAVLKSRQACLDAHVYERINDDSPLIQKRAAIDETKLPRGPVAAA